MNGSQAHPLADYYSRIYRSYDRVNRVFTFGQDRHWRKRAVEACLREQPRKILDICTGTGDFILETARKADSGTELFGYDFSPEMLRLARQKHQALNEREGILPVGFLEGNVAGMPFEDRFFDAAGITFGMRNLVWKNPDAARHLSEIRRVLKPGGLLAVLESSRPSGRLWRIFHTLYLQGILPYLGGMLSGHPDAYRYLSSSSRNYYSIPEMNRVLENAGFTVLSGEPLFMGSVMLVTARRN